MISSDKLSRSGLPEFNLGELSRDELRGLTIPSALCVILPLPSIGRTNQHIDICSDLVDVSWVAEHLAGYVDVASAEEEYDESSYSTQVRMTLNGPKPGLLDALQDAILVFQGDEDNQIDSAKVRYTELRTLILDYEDELHSVMPRFPEIIDHYYANLLGGGYHHYQSEAPEYFKDEMARFPERQLGFFRSAFSAALGGDAFASHDSWMMSVAIHPDKFFSTTGQTYRIDQFDPGEIFMIGGRSLVRLDSDLLWFPMNQYFKSRACEGLAIRDDSDWPTDRFAWIDASFTFSPFHEAVRQSVPETSLARAPQNEHCLVHQSGTLIIVSDGGHYHYLYDTGSLNEVERRRVYDYVAELGQNLGSAIGITGHSALDWSALDDDQFEQLCYDLVFANPKFDSDTIRRMGKSRSRDGGRDIVVEEVRRFPLDASRKWIFQCKLIRDGSSLTATKLRDVGDMLDQYGAGGFGVFTSAPIDATLYDKLDGVCQRRGIKQSHYSVHELERRLARYPAILRKYFP